MGELSDFMAFPPLVQNIKNIILINFNVFPTFTNILQTVLSFELMQKTRIPDFPPAIPHTFISNKLKTGRHMKHFSNQ